MRQLFLPGIFVAATAVFVVGGDGGVVIAGHARDAACADHVHDFVGPGRVADKIAKVIHRVDSVGSADVVENRPEGGKIAVDIRYQRVSHDRVTVAGVVDLKYNQYLGLS